MLWVATVVVIASATFPNYVGYLLAGSAPAEATVPAKEFTTVHLSIEGMTCDGCAAVIRSALAKVPGVHSASASYPDADALVTLDPASPPSIDALVAAVNKAGFRASGPDRLGGDSERGASDEDD